jgi:hypothetical protein
MAPLVVEMGMDSIEMLPTVQDKLVSMKTPPKPEPGMIAAFRDMEWLSSSLFFDRELRFIRDRLSMPLFGTRKFGP